LKIRQHNYLEVDDYASMFKVNAMPASALLYNIIVDLGPIRGEEINKRAHKIMPLLKLELHNIFESLSRFENVMF